MYYAEKELLKQFALTQAVYIRNIQSKEQLLDSFYWQLKLSRRPNSYDELESQLKAMARCAQIPIFVVHDGWLKLPIGDQLDYISVLYRCSMRIDNQPSRITAFFDLADKNSLENLHYLVCSDEAVRSSYFGQVACA